MSNIGKTFATKVVSDEDGQTVILFPENLIETLELRENEILLWELTSERKITITRPKYIHNETSKAALDELTKED